MKPNSIKTTAPFNFSKLIRFITEGNTLPGLSRSTRKAVPHIGKLEIEDKMVQIKKLKENNLYNMLYVNMSVIIGHVPNVKHAILSANLHFWSNMLL